MLRGMAQVIPFEERAVAKLRDRLGAVESANEDLIAFARGHSGVTAAIHAAVLAAIEADGAFALFEAVTEVWPRLLGLDHVAMALVADGQGFRVGAGYVGTVEPRIVDRAIERLEPVTMRTVGCGHPLFGAAARDIRSESLILLPAQAPLPYGLLLLGQSDSASHDTRHGAQLLGFLGSSLGAMIRRCLIDN
jgi:uncharacterized protein YigA (DUF484 family)